MKRLSLLLTLLLTFLAGGAARAQRIQDAGFRTVGYIKDDGTVQDSGFRTVGYIKDNGTVQDAGYRTIGYVKKDGTIQDAAFRTIGHAPGIPLSHAAWWFFFR